VFLNIKPSSSKMKVKSITVEYSITVESDDKCIIEDSCVYEFKGKNFAFGWAKILSSKEVKEINSPVNVIMNAFVKKLEMEQPLLKRKRNNSIITKQSNDEYSMLCASLNNLQGSLTSDMDSLYSNKYFFSKPFRTSLAHKVSACRGGIGLPGAISQHVPVNILKDLSKKIPDVVSNYRKSVVSACNDKMNEVVMLNVDQTQYRKLHDLIIMECTNILEKHSSTLSEQHDLILDFESSIVSSNHYFMDTVNSVRKDLSDSDEDRPLYLKKLSTSIIAAMSNEDQRLVDMQIEIFAYWKLMKKRLIDYIIMATTSCLVDKLIKDQLKVSLLEAVLRHNDKELVQLSFSRCRNCQQAQKH